MIILFDFLSLEKWIKGLKPNLAASCCQLVALVPKARATASRPCRFLSVHVCFLGPRVARVLVSVLVAVLFNPHGRHVLSIKSLCHCHLQGSDCQGQGPAAHGCHVIGPDRLGHRHPQQAGAAWDSTPCLPRGSGGKLIPRSHQGLGVS